MKIQICCIVSIFLLSQNTGPVSAQRGPRSPFATARQPLLPQRPTSSTAAVAAPAHAPISSNGSHASPRGREAPPNSLTGVVGAPLTANNAAGQRVSPPPVVGTFSLDAVNGTIDYIISGLQNSTSPVLGGIYQFPADTRRGANETAGRLVATLQQQRRYGTLLAGAVTATPGDVAGILTDPPRYQVVITTANGTTYRGDLTPNVSSLLGLPPSFVLNAANELRSLQGMLGTRTPFTPSPNTTERVATSTNHPTRRQSTAPDQNSVFSQPSLSSGNQLPSPLPAARTPSGIVPNQARPADALPPPTSPDLTSTLLSVASALVGGGGSNLAGTLLSALSGAGRGNVASASTTSTGGDSGSALTSTLRNFVAQGLTSYLEGQLGIRTANPTSGLGTSTVNTNALLSTIINTIANANGISGATASPVTVGSSLPTPRNSGASSTNAGTNAASLLGAAGLGNLGGQLPTATPSSQSGSNTNIGGDALSQFLNPDGGLYGGGTSSSSLLNGGLFSPDSAGGTLDPSSASTAGNSAALSALQQVLGGGA